MKRREFLKILAGSAAVAAIPELVKAETSQNPVDVMQDILESKDYDSLNKSRIMIDDPVLSIGDSITFEGNDKIYRIVSNSSIDGV